MNTIKILSLFIFTLIIGSCSSTKKVATDDLFNTTWELEYLSGPRIAFDGLYPDKRPKITFNKTTNRVEGNNSCNGYSADYTLNGDGISFGEPGPTTMMYCGEGETFFLNTIKKVNKYKIDDDGKLNLMIDDVPMMRFKKSALEMGCYSYHGNGNAIDLEITGLNNGVSGKLMYALDGKDRNSGTFSGRLNGDKLLGTYTFISEGIESMREVAFLIKDNQLIEGYGELNENGTTFVDRSNLSYTSTMPLTKTDCDK